MQTETEVLGHILLVEDDAINSELYGMTLERGGYSVRYASNGESALEALCEERFDCVLMDIEMSVLNGLEATRMIRDGKAGPDNRSIPIIGMSAHEGDLVSQFVNAGINIFLHKPVELELLENTVAEALRGGSLKKTVVQNTTPRARASSTLDREGALKRLKNNSKLLDKITIQVLEEADPLLQGLRLNLSEGDYESLSATAHRYAGSLASIGAMTGSLICREIMTLSRRGFIRHIGPLLDRLQKEIADIRLLVKPF